MAKACAWWSSRRASAGSCRRWSTSSSATSRFQPGLFPRPLASERELFRVGQDQAVVTGICRRARWPACSTGDHRAADPPGQLHRRRMRVGRRTIRRVQRGLEEVTELAGAGAPGDQRSARRDAAHDAPKAAALRSGTSTWPMAPSRCCTIQPQSAAGHGHLPGRAVGLGQVDLAALSQPPRRVPIRRHPARWRKHPRQTPDQLRRRVGMVFQHSTCSRTALRLTTSPWPCAR